MGFKPKQILDTALGLGKTAVSEAERRLRGRGSATAPTSGAPTTVGAAEPGKPGAPKSATAPGAKPAETAAAAGNSKVETAPEADKAASGKNE
jgi:hypothetical protein